MTDHSEQKVLCRNITLLRKLNRMSRKRMAEVMGVSVYCVRKAERGQVPPMLDANAILRLGRYFGLSPAELYCPVTKLSLLIKEEIP